MPVSGTVPFLDRLKADPAAVARFWDRVRHGDCAECWPIKIAGASTMQGYGRFKVGKDLIGAHRIAWALENDMDPVGHLIRHSCDNPGCCNPAHLLVGDHADNANDKVERNRWRSGDHRGERNPRAKLTRQQVKRIVGALKRGEPNKSIARRYPVSHHLISRIATGKAWVAEAAAAGWQPAIERITASLPHSVEDPTGENH